MSDDVTTWQPRIYEEANYLLTHSPARLTDAHLTQLRIWDAALAQHATEARLKALHPDLPVPRPAPPRKGLDYDALAEVVADAIKAAVAPLHARIEALERRPELKFVGPFRGGTHYLAGTIVQKQGLWLCEADTHATPGEEDSGWRLILKAAPR